MSTSFFREPVDEIRFPMCLEMKLVKIRLLSDFLLYSPPVEFCSFLNETKVWQNRLKQKIHLMWPL